MRLNHKTRTRVVFTVSQLLLVLLCSQPFVSVLEAGELDPEDNRLLEEVEVTAQKREQDVTVVPIALSVLGYQQLLEAGAYDMSSVARLVPVLGVQENISPLASDFRIRRVGRIGNIPTFEPAVGVFIDGAYRSQAVFATGDLLNVERIEILHGPQNSLYGKNTSAGVIGIYTRLPGGEPGGYAELTGGVYDAQDVAPLWRGRAGVSGPLTETSQAGVDLAWTANQEWMGQALLYGGESANNLDRVSLRGQLNWEVNDQFSLRLIAGGMWQDDKSTTSDLYYDPQGYLPYLLSTLQAADVSVPCSDNNPHNRIGCSRLANTTDLEYGDVTLVGEYELNSGWILTSITSWDGFSFKGTADDVFQVSAPVGQFHDSQDGHSLQQELHLEGNATDAVDWLAGVFWYHNTVTRGDGGQRPIFLSDIYSANTVLAALNQQLLGTPFPLPTANPGELAYLDASQDSDYFSVYGQIDWRVNKRFSLGAALRWQTERKKAFLRQWTSDPSPSIFSLLVTPANVGGDMQRDTSDLTWSATAQYFLKTDGMFYATVSTGFKSGGFNIGFGRSPLSQREFGDESLFSSEVGFKTTLRGGRMFLAGNVFKTDYDDFQDAAFIGTQFQVGNAEQVSLRGAELAGQLLAGEHLSADFAVSYADLTYERQTNGLCYPGRPPDSPTTPGACVLDGDRPIDAPLWKTHLGLEYRNEVTWGEVAFRADWAFTSQYNTSFSADPRLVQHAYNWITFRLGISRGRYELIAWVDNALNETVVNFDAVLSFYTGDNSYQSFLQAPRSYGLTFRVVLGEAP